MRQATQEQVAHDLGLWDAADRLLAAMSPEAVRINRVLALAARRLRRLELEIPRDFAHEERATRTAMMIVPSLLGRIRDAFDGPLLVIKGPEVAALYPDAARSFDDLDLLVEDARTAQAALIAAGFVEVPDPTDHFLDIHHLPPLVWPELPIKVEVHERPKWPHELPTPPAQTLFDEAVPSFCAIDGVEAPAPHHHALIVAAHAWAHAPLRDLRDLLDVAATAGEADESELTRTAQDWLIERMWNTTRATIRWRLYGASPPVAVSVWARHLIALREATVLEGHVARWAAPFSLLPPVRALPVALRRVVEDLKPEGETSWPAKARRVVRAMRHALHSKSEHGWKNEDSPPPTPLPRRGPD
jgi:hypothetical protein